MRFVKAYLIFSIVAIILGLISLISGLYVIVNVPTFLGLAFGFICIVFGIVDISFALLYLITGRRLPFLILLGSLIFVPIALPIVGLMAFTLILIMMAFFLIVSLVIFFMTIRWTLAPAMKVCPSCRSPNPPHAKFCLECGSKLE